MGCWNGTCSISNLHIHAGKRVMVFILSKNNRPDSLCYSNALYSPCLFPFYGEYDDYGGVENCTGETLPLLLDTIKSKLFEYDLGENKYHDIEVKAENFNIELLFAADHEGRLAISEYDPYGRSAYNAGISSQSEQDKLDNLYMKLLKPGYMKQELTHITIHGDIADAILTKYYISNYVGEGKGTVGYGNCYNHIYFKDIVDAIPAAVDLCKKLDPNILDILGFRALGSSDNIALTWLQDLNNRSHEFSIMSFIGLVDQLMRNGQWDSIPAIFESALTGLWIDTYMNRTRKLWVPTGGKGSQSSDHQGYRLLTNAINSVLDNEQHHFDDDE